MKIKSLNNFTFMLMNGRSYVGGQNIEVVSLSYVEYLIG